MRILQVHNFYMQAGGEDNVLQAEYQVLSAHGHFVKQYTVSNDSVAAVPAIKLAIQTIWSSESYRAIRRAINEDAIELVHVHNTLPLISPSVYYAAEAEGVPVVQHLHNYRLLCPSATLFRDGGVCEDCLKLPLKYPAVLHRCYRNSLPASATVAAMLALNQAAGTWNSKVDTYIALSEYMRSKFIEGGFPARKLTVKQNFLANDPGTGTGSGQYALFVGRLSPEKGLDTLLRAWERAGPSVPLKICGSGPLESEVAARSRRLPNVDYLGSCDRSQVISLLQNAAVCVAPSEWYEGFPLAVVESLACGTPVIASALGAMNDVISDGVNGVLFEARNSDMLAQKVYEIVSDGERLPALRASARRSFEENYTADITYKKLMQIYDDALSRHIR